MIASLKPAVRMDCVDAQDHGSLGPPIQSASLRWCGCWSCCSAIEGQMVGAKYE
jgi:hypothetical protein